MSKVWFITGCSSGFGKHIAEAALHRGDTVIATARTLSSLAPLSAQNALTYELDVTWPDAEINAVVSDALSKTGRIDILVNNAGYILTGGIEEVTAEEVFQQYNTNVLGQINLSRCILPHMRSNHSGIICNMSSIGAWRGVAGAGIYCSSKAAASINSEALRAEVASQGIEVVAVEPGYFRTNFLSQGNRKRAARRVDAVTGPVEGAVRVLDGKDGRQLGDPVKGARVLVEVLSKTGRGEGRKGLPARLALGNDSVSLIPGILERVRGDIEGWKEVTGGTDFE